jgi:hypothetical protein
VSDIHSTDTHGFSEAIFAVTHLLGISFAPRIKNLKKQSLYMFRSRRGGDRATWAIKPDQYVDPDSIIADWDDVLRLVATIKLKESTASDIFSGLNSYSRQHSLYTALKAFGRIIKSMFILRYIDDVELRMAIENLLNRIELGNRFTRVIAVGNPREFSAGDKEEQEIAETCNRLIKNAIVCWNYLLLEHRLNQASTEELRAEIRTAVANYSVISWGYINLLGEYDFSDEKLRDSVGIPPPKIPPLKLGGEKSQKTTGFRALPGQALSLYVPLSKGTHRRIREVLRRLLGDEQLDILTQRALVAFQSEDVIGLLLIDLSRDGALTAHRVDRDDCPLDRQHVENLWDRDDFVGLFRHLDLPQHEALVRDEGRNHMDGAFTGLSPGSAHGLAINRHHPGRHTDQQGGPGDEAALKLLRIEGGEDIAEVVVRWSTVEEWPETTEKFEFLATKSGDVHEGFGSGQHREQRQQQHLIKRIHEAAILNAHNPMLFSCEVLLS